MLAIQELQIAKNALEELKGIDIITLDVSHCTSFTSYMLICTGSSSRHLKSLADNVERVARTNDLTALGYEGGNDCNWILVDLGSVIVHAMTAEAREFYNLEKLWASFDTEPVAIQQVNEN